MRIVLALIVSSFCFLSLGLGATAGEIRLDQQGMPFSRISVREQKNIGNCYAQSAVQLFDTIRLVSGEGLNNETSAIAAAIEWNMSDSAMYQAKKERAEREGLQKSALWDGGTICDSFNYLVKSGGLPYRAKREAFLAQMNNRYGTKLDKFTEEQTLDEMDFIIRESQGALAPLPPDAERKFSELKRDPQADLLVPLWAVFHDVADQRIRLSSSVRASCTPIEVALDTVKSRELFSTLLSARNRSIPVGIEFCSAIFRQNKGSAYQGITRNAAGEFAVARDCAPHAALITGMRTKDGIRQYLIRNSWGTTTKGVNEYWDDEEHTWDKYSSDWEFESTKGSLWIDAELVERNTSFINDIQVM